MASHNSTVLVLPLGIQRRSAGEEESHGSQPTTAPRDLIYIPPGHDGWVVGDEPMLLLQIEGAATYAAK
jgi:hypothetical protein